MNKKQAPYLLVCLFCSTALMSDTIKTAGKTPLEKHILFLIVEAKRRSLGKSEND